jgi:hypothetical protein
LRVVATPFGMDDREQANQDVAEYVARMRRRLADGKDEIERQQASIRWLKTAESPMGDEETVRDATRGDQQ